MNDKEDSIILNFIKKIIKSDKKQQRHTEPVVYPRSQHNISRSQISENALKVLYRLKKSGYESYLVGGCVRDLLLGREPKDFDVVTDASPEQVRQVFRNCRLIGRRFRLAHVHFGREIIEVATFRGTTAEKGNHERVQKKGRLLRDNVYGTIEEDVWRRDFTVNALYYNIRDFSVVDYVDGMSDHRNGVLRLIGDPVTRYHEDPVRMLRAIRFAVKLGFMLHPDCEKPIKEMSGLLSSIPPARLYDENLKLFLSGYALQTYEMLRHYELFSILFPATDECLTEQDHGFPKLFIVKALQNTDIRIAGAKGVTPYFLLAAFLWEPVRALAMLKMEQGVSEAVAFQEAGGEVISRQVKSTAFPRRVGLSMREVWNLQARFNKRTGVRPQKLLSHPRFRAAYDFLLLRSETGQVDKELADWWTRFQEADEKEQQKMTRTAGKRTGRQRRPRRNYRSKAQQN